MNEPAHNDNDSIESIEAANASTVARLEAERPVPAPTFRGNLRRRLEGGHSRSAAALSGWLSAPALAGSYLVAGAILLAVTAVGLAGIGPFSA
jgi:hypothetical protein